MSAITGDGQSYLIALDPYPPRVEAWSTERLPFEPRGTLAAFRTELHTAVTRLAAAPGEGLHATYTSPIRGHFDVENVLLYNVGPSAFRSSAAAALIVERDAAPVPMPPAALAGARHHYAYAVVPSRDRWARWSTSRILVTFGPSRLSGVADLSRLAAVWLGIRRGPTTAEAAADPLTEIGLELQVSGVPQHVALNLASLAKPLIDGTVAAFHVHHDPLRARDVAARVAVSLGVGEPDTRALLMDNPAAVLGSRRLLWPWRDGVQWNPADDRCAAIRISLVDETDPTDCDGVRLRGCLVAVEPIVMRS